MIGDEDGEREPRPFSGGGAGGERFKAALKPGVDRGPDPRVQRAGGVETGGEVGREGGEVAPRGRDRLVPRGIGALCRQDAGRDHTVEYAVAGGFGRVGKAVGAAGFG